MSDFKYEIMLRSGAFVCYVTLLMEAPYQDGKEELEVITQNNWEGTEFSNTFEELKKGVGDSPHVTGIKPYGDEDDDTPSISLEGDHYLVRQTFCAEVPQNLEQVDTVNEAIKKLVDIPVFLNVPHISTKCKI